MFKVVNYYRLSVFFYRNHIPVVPKFLDYLIRLIFSCWLPHTVKAGKNLILGYGGLGVVIHSNAEIGNNVHIDQCVTIGGNGVEEGVPVIENDVYIGAGSVIIGPVRIGEGAIIGANSLVNRDVESRTVVAGNPARVIKTDININQYLYHRDKRV